MIDVDFIYYTFVKEKIKNVLSRVACCKCRFYLRLVNVSFINSRTTSTTSSCCFLLLLFIYVIVGI